MSRLGLSIRALQEAIQYAPGRSPCFRLAFVAAVMVSGCLMTYAQRRMLMSERGSIFCRSPASNWVRSFLALPETVESGFSHIGLGRPP